MAKAVQSSRPESRARDAAGPASEQQASPARGWLRLRLRRTITPTYQRIRISSRGLQRVPARAGPAVRPIGSIPAVLPIPACAGTTAVFYTAVDGGGDHTAFIRA